MDTAQRIAQFENMAAADPSNEMTHFSLARAYVEAGRFEEGAASYLRCIDIVPDMSKAYQMAGDALLKAGQKDRAADILLKGYEVAAKKGDRMPRDAIADLLRSMGKSPPEIKGAPTDEQIAATGSFICAKTGRPGKQRPAPPF
ncbi:MAG: hypothetical protein JNM07_15690, partial [Phycisphaerae bacterium]|nr:hypothetical protein [Phycisphaerae bacterium]